MISVQQTLASFGSNLFSLSSALHASNNNADTSAGGTSGASLLHMGIHLRETVNTLVTDLRSTASTLIAQNNFDSKEFVCDQLHIQEERQPLSALLLPEVMLHVFSFMSPEDALLAAPVCKAWYEAATSPMLWSSKVCPHLATACNCPLFDPSPPQPSSPSLGALHGSHDRLTSEMQTAEAPSAELSQHEQQRGLACLGRPLTLHQLWLAFHHRNFLRNPGFQRLLNTQRASLKKWRRNAWVFPTTGGDGVSWECPPVQCEAVPEAPKLFPAGSGAGGIAARAQQQLQGLLTGEAGSCIATSSDWNEAMQVVDFSEELQRRGLSKEQAEHMLDSGLPLGFSIYVGSHAQSGGQFSSCLFLLEKEPDDVLNIAQRFVAKPYRYMFYSGKLKTTVAGKWQRFAHVVDSAPRGFRYGIILLRAKDQNAVKGHFGAKLACAQLTFLHQSEKERFAKDADHTAWLQRMVEANLIAPPAAEQALAPEAANVEAA